MNAVVIEGVWKFYGDYPALRDVKLTAEAGACLALDRPQRRRQDDAASHGGGILAARPREDYHLRQRTSGY